MGHYEVVSQLPKIDSPMGVIPEPGGGVRLIHDCSLPKGQTVKDYCTSDWHQKFSRVEDAAALVMEGYYVAKVDLQAAYRHVKISEQSKQVTGLKWQFGQKKLCTSETPVSVLEVHCNLRVIRAAPHHRVTIYEVSA